MIEIFLVFFFFQLQKPRLGEVVSLGKLGTYSQLVTQIPAPQEALWQMNVRPCVFRKLERGRWHRKKRQKGEISGLRGLTKKSHQRRVRQRAEATGR
jgi:hypothetical protein